MNEPNYTALSREDLEQIFHKDYNGPMQLERHRFLKFHDGNFIYACIFNDPNCDEGAYQITRIFIGLGPNGLSLDFQGNCECESDDLDIAVREYNNLK